MEAELPTENDIVHACQVLAITPKSRLDDLLRGWVQYVGKQGTNREKWNSAATAAWRERVQPQFTGPNAVAKAWKNERPLKVPMLKLNQALLLLRDYTLDQVVPALQPRAPSRSASADSWFFKSKSSGIYYYQSSLS